VLLVRITILRSLHTINSEDKPDKLSADGTESRLFKKRCHKLVSVDLVNTAFQSPASLVHRTLLLFEHSLLWQLYPQLQPTHYCLLT